MGDKTVVIRLSTPNPNEFSGRISIHTRDAARFRVTEVTSGYVGTRYRTWEESGQVDGLIRTGQLTHY